MKKISLEEVEKYFDKETSKKIKRRFLGKDYLYLYPIQLTGRLSKPVSYVYKQGMQSFVKEILFSSSNEFLNVPVEIKKWRYVLQLHSRGKTVHADLRLEREKDLLGWTLLIQNPNSVEKPIETLQQLKEHVKKNVDKIDWKTGNIKKRRIRSGIIRSASIRVVKKAPEPMIWLYKENEKINFLDLAFEYFIDEDNFIEGVVKKGEVGATKNYPGVFLIVDKGRVEYLSQKPYFHEYWFSGGLLKEGRWIMRALLQNGKFAEDVLPPGKVPEEKEIREPFYWILIQATDQTPYVISNEAVKKNWVPDYGFSALPEKIRKQVPQELQYWNEKVRTKRIKIRNQLVEYFKKNKIKFSESEDLKLFRIWWKRHDSEGREVIVIRWGASTEYYILKIGNLVFSCESNPFKGKTFCLKENFDTNLDKIKDGKVLEVGTELNPTKNTWAKIEIIEHGKADILEKKEDFVKFQFKNKLYVIKKIEGEPFWQIEESKLPETS